MYSKRIVFVENEKDIELNDPVKFVKIDCSALFTKEAVFECFSQKLDFPFTVENWDGFNDFFWDADAGGNLRDNIKKLSIYIYNLKDLLKKSKHDKRIFYSIINEDYVVNENDEQGKLNFPAEVYVYINKSDKPYVVETPVELIYSSN